VTRAPFPPLTRQSFVCGRSTQTRQIAVHHPTSTQVSFSPCQKSLWWSSYRHVFFPSSSSFNLQGRFPTVSSLASAAPKFAALGSPAWLCFASQRPLICDSFRFSCRAFHRASALEGLKKDSASKAAHVYASPFSEFPETTDWHGHLKRSAHKPRYSKQL
jgi:hypothetical protein